MIMQNFILFFIILNIMDQLRKIFYLFYIIPPSFTHKYTHGINKLTKRKGSWNSSTKIFSVISICRASGKGIVINYCPTNYYFRNNLLAVSNIINSKNFTFEGPSTKAKPGKTSISEASEQI